jgi:hypothetical protein
MFGLPEAKLIRDTYMTTFGTMSDPNLRARFQGLIALGTVSALIILAFCTLIPPEMVTGLICNCSLS